MFEQFIKPKNIAKIIMTIVALFLVSMTLQETFSSYVDPSEIQVTEYILSVEFDSGFTDLEEPHYDSPVSITKTAPSTGLVGDTLTHALDVRNIGDIPLSGLVVTGVHQSELENPRDLMLPEGSSGDFIGNLLEVNLGTLTAGENVVITFVADIAADVEVGTVITNTIIVRDPNNPKVGDEDYSLIKVIECLSCPPCPPDEECPPCLPVEECPQCPPDEQCPPCPPAKPEQPTSAPETPARPTLPQTGAIAGASILTGIILVASGLAVVSRKKRLNEKLSPEISISQMHEDEYSDIFGDEK